MKNLLYLSILSLLVSCTSKQPIAEWRGPGRTGIYNEKNLQNSWEENGPSEILNIEKVGNGYGSPVISDDRIYVTGEIDSTLVLHCYDIKGNIIWETPLGKEWTESFRGSRSAPTVVDDLIYACTGLGNLFCLEKATGKIKWSKDFITDYKGVHPMFGHAEAPAVFNDKVFWTVGGTEHNVVALNRFTGDLIWTNKGFGERSAYNQPVVFQLPSGNVFVTFSAYHLMGFDVETGKLLWSHEQDNYPVDKRAPGYGDTHGNTVLYNDGFLYYAEGDGNCGVKLKLQDSTVSEIWRNKGLDTYMGGIVKINDYLYGCGYMRNQFVSVNANSGEITDSLKVGRGVVISADKMLYYYTEKGDMKLISYNDGKLKEISSFKITKGSKEHFSHPVIYKGILYVRRGDALMAYDIRKV